MKYSTLKTLEDKSLYSSIRSDEDKPVVIRLNNVKLVDNTLNDDEIWFSWLNEDPSNLNEIEAELLVDIKSDPVRWFNKKVKDTTIDSSFQTCISQNGQFQVTKSQSVKVFNKETKEPWVDDVTSENECDILVQVQGVSFFKRSFQLNLKLHQVQVTPKVEEKPEEICHDDWVMDDYGFEA